MKVFVTVGSMLPFNRLVRAADAWLAGQTDVQGMAQVGAGGYTPRHMAWQAMLSPTEYRMACEQADVIVSHVGMGTVITAAELQRPLVAVPRRQELAEVTSDHQLATARWLRDRPGVIVLDDTEGLGEAIRQAANGAPMADLLSGERDRLIRCVRTFVIQAVRSRS